MVAYGIFFFNLPPTASAGAGLFHSNPIHMEMKKTKSVSRNGKSFKIGKRVNKYF